MRVSKPTLNRLILGTLTLCSEIGDYWGNTGLVSAACPLSARHAMRIQLTLHGGSYGTLPLQPIETDDTRAPFSEELLDVIRSSAFEVYRSKRLRKASGEASGVDQIQTGREVYEFRISAGAESTRQYLIPHSAIERDEGLAKLVDFIWSSAKPI